MLHAVGDWEVCGDCFYAKELLYDMQWEDVDLEQRRWVMQASTGRPPFHREHVSCVFPPNLHLHYSQTAPKPPQPIIPVFTYACMQGVLCDVWRAHRLHAR